MNDECMNPTPEEAVILNLLCPNSRNSNACHSVACMPDAFNSNACCTVIEDSVNPNACPTVVEENEQSFDLSHLLACEVLPFLKLIFHKFVIPSGSDLSDELCLSHVVVMFEQLCAKYADQGLLQDDFSLITHTVHKFIWSFLFLVIGFFFCRFVRIDPRKFGTVFLLGSRSRLRSFSCCLLVSLFRLSSLMN